MPLIGTIKSVLSPNELLDISPVAVRGYIRIGDGKIFIMDLDEVIRIRTEERRQCTLFPKKNILTLSLFSRSNWA
jgi:Nitrogen regulatory protein P-II